MNTLRCLRYLLLVLVGLYVAGCGGRPTQVLGDAETALANATLARKCAPDELAAAERMFAKAKTLADAGENAKAEAAARAAKKLAKKAVEKAEARKEECLKPPEAKTDPQDFVDTSGPGMDSMDPNRGGMETVYFDYNTADLRDAGKQVMKNNAEWLRGNGAVKITVVGHCDARGSTEYNLALGEKRAQTARKYLIEMGVARERLGVVSYGEEQPADYGDTDASHSRNRRAEFRVAE
jgi:peptidoglycan-associated lipoprotein